MASIRLDDWSRLSGRSVWTGFLSSFEHARQVQRSMWKEKGRSRALHLKAIHSKAIRSKGCSQKGALIETLANGFDRWSATRKLTGKNQSDLSDLKLRQSFSRGRILSIHWESPAPIELASKKETISYSSYFSVLEVRRRSLWLPSCRWPLAAVALQRW